MEALIPYQINPMNHTETTTPHYLGNHIYLATNEGNPTKFLIWIATSGINTADHPVYVTILYTMLQYA